MTLLVGAPPASTNIGVALIVYEGETKACWRLLMRSNMHTHLEVAMDELRVWLMDMMYTDIGKSLTRVRD